MSFISNAALNELSNVYAKRVLVTEAISVEQLMKSRDVSQDVARAIIAMDTTPSKSDALQLANFYNDIAGDDADRLTTLKHYYESFDALRRRRQINAQINAFKTFEEFEHEIDARAAVRFLTQADATIDATPDYEDEYIAVYEANTPAEACELGKAYPFCISRRGSSNMFYSYKGRINSYTKPGDAATGTWFVRLKKRLNGEAVSSKRDESGKWEQPEHMIVIHYSPDHELRWTWADNGSQGHGTKDTSKEEILQQFPEFKPLFASDKNIKASSFSEKEVKVHRMLAFLERSAKNFNEATQQQKEFYIKTYGKIPFEKETYVHLNAALRNELYKYIADLSIDLWDAMPDAEKMKMAKIAMNPHVHTRDSDTNTSIITKMLVYDMQ